MKTIRLLYPDYISGGLDTYYFGAKLLQYILPKNKNQPLVEVDIMPPNGEKSQLQMEFWVRMRCCMVSKMLKIRSKKKISR